MHRGEWRGRDIELEDLGLRSTHINYHQPQNKNPTFTLSFLPFTPFAPALCRYSDEFKYRPAASPVITEYLPGNRIRLRGATPGGVGIRPGDLPKTPQELARDKKKREEQALKDAKRQLGVKERRKVGKANHGVLRGGE